MTGSSSCNASRAPLGRVASELDALGRVPLHTTTNTDGSDFPSACRSMLYSLPGNSFCVDCGIPSPEWASVTYGVLLCVQCSGRHRSYGVQTSFVRSIAMDDWSQAQVLAMLEGGNEQLQSFFERHQMGNDCNPTLRMTDTRYRTKAALFYSSHLKRHVKAVAQSGPYTGREATRQKHNDNNNDNHSSSTQQQHQQRKMHHSVEQHCQQQQPIAVGNQ